MSKLRSAYRRLLYLCPFALIFLTGRSSLREVYVPDRNHAAPVYDPRSYYTFINTEIAPHLLFCPKFEDPRALLAVQRQGVSLDELVERMDSEGRPDGDEAKFPESAPSDSCDCGERRLNAWFCLKPVNPDLKNKILRYKRMSWLQDDLGYPGRWLIEAPTDSKSNSDLRVSLLPGVHRQSLPGGATRPRYDGSIYFHPERGRAVLIDGAGNEHILLPRKGHTAEANLSAWRNLQQVAAAGGDTGRWFHRGDSLALYDTAGNRIRFQTSQGSDPLIVIVEQTTGELSVSVDGAPLVTQQRRWILGLRPRQQIQLRLDDGPPLVLKLSQRQSAALSELQVTPEGTRRVYNEESGVDDYVRALVSSLNEAATSLAAAYQDCGMKSEPASDMLPNIEPLARADIWLTLDPVLQGAAQRHLEKYAEDGEASQGHAVHRGRDGLWRAGDQLIPPPHFSLVAVDADRDEVLAAAAYPSTAGVRRQLASLDKEESDVAPRLREDLDEELKRESLHLRPHVIGSVFKPLFAWAAGSVNPALVDFTLPSSHRVDWAFTPKGVRNRIVDQCLISTRWVEATHEFHFQRAYSGDRPGFDASCDGKGAAGQEDLCLALAASDTYWFLELAARLLALANKRALPARDTPHEQRDYGLTELCKKQILRDPQSKHELQICGDHETARSLLPVSCGSGSQNPFCPIMKHYLSIDFQNVGVIGRSTENREFLGPLIKLVERVAHRLPSSECAGLPKWADDTDYGFKWQLPAPPKWPADLVKQCAPYFEMFVQGAHVNLWNNFHLAQALTRLFTGRESARLRLVAEVREGGRPQPVRATAAPPSVLPIDASCQPGAPSVRCHVLRGMELAIEKGTLRQLSGVAPLLGISADADEPALKVRLFGKTGTSRVDRFPTYRQEMRDGRLRWTRASTIRKSIHTALLIEVTTGAQARHFVVYLCIEGVDEAYTSRAAAAFFRPDRPGYQLLKELVNYVRAQGAT